MTGVPFIPDNAPFTAEQKLWLNGFLAGLFAAAGAAAAEARGAAAEAAPAKPLLILFGSQSGTAEALAKRLARQAQSGGWQARALDAAAHASVDWANENYLFVTTSTYGDGDMPDNAQDFWRWLQTDAARILAHLQFSVLGLGDHNYPDFCAAGKKIDARLDALGARRIFPRADCGVDYEAPSQAWIDGALRALAAPAADPAPRAKSAETSSASRRQSLAMPAPSAPPADSRPAPFSRSNPFPARLLANRRLNREGSSKETRHFEFSIEGSGFAHEPGDAFGVFPTNPPARVEEILRALGCDGEEAAPAPGGGAAELAAELPLRKALSECYDISKPTRELLQRLAEKNPNLRERLGPGREEALKEWLWGREIIDLLIETPEPGLAPGEFARLLRKLAPRLYSISSSPRAHAGQIHLTVNIVRHETGGRARQGVCSTFLAERVGHPWPAPSFIQPAPNFRLPPPDTPMIMVGPGTGIAPFRAFLHDRQAAGARGRNWLFFGEQRAAADFYYQEEFAQMLADGHLTQLSTAFSRDQAEKVYVQHRMLEQAADLWSWLREGAHFYVCGDATRMAKDVDAALRAVAAKAGGLDPDAAEAFVQQLKNEKRYQRDVY